MSIKRYQLRKRSIFQLDKKQPEKLLAQTVSLERLLKSPFFVDMDKTLYYVAEVEIFKGKTEILQEIKI